MAERVGRGTGAHFQRGSGVGEDQAGCERGQRWSGDEDGSVEGFGLRVDAGSSGEGGRWRGNGDFGLGFLLPAVDLGLS